MGCRGFTLLELLASIAVLSILVGLGVPAFNDTIRNNQIATSSSNLVGALALARNEAMKRGVRVSVCATADQVTCTADQAWSNGWIAFVDNFAAPGVIDEGDVVLRIWNGVGGVDVNSEQAAAVSFTARGRAEAAQQFTVSKAGCSGNQERRIEIGAVGRISLTRQECAGD